MNFGKIVLTIGLSIFLILSLNCQKKEESKKEVLEFAVTEKEQLWHYIPDNDSFKNFKGHVVMDITGNKDFLVFSTYQGLNVYDKRAKTNIVLKEDERFVKNIIDNNIIYAASYHNCLMINTGTYDTKSITTFYNINPKGGAALLKNDDILYIGQKGCKLTRLNLSTGKSKQIQFGPAGFNRVSSLSMYKGNIIGTTWHGVFQLNEDDKIDFIPSNKIMNINSQNKFYYKTDHISIVGGYGGLAIKYKDYDWNIIQADATFDYLHYDNNFFFATQSGILMYNLNTKEKKWITESDGLINNNTQSIYLDKYDSMVYIGTSKGACSIHWTDFINLFKEEKSIQLSDITSLSKQEISNWHIITSLSYNIAFINIINNEILFYEKDSFYGLNIFTAKNRIISHIKLPKLHYRNITRYIKYKDYIFVGTKYDGLFIYKNNRLIKHLTIKKELDDNFIRDVRIIDNKLYIITHIGSITLSTVSGRIIKSWRAEKELPYSTFYGIHLYDNKIYINDFYHGILVFDKELKNYKKISFQFLISASDIIDNYIWAGSGGNMGLKWYDLTTGEIINTNIGKKYNIDYFYNIKQYFDIVYCATSSGLLVYHLPTKKWNMITRDDGLPSQTISSIYCDNNIITVYSGGKLAYKKIFSFNNTDNENQYLKGLAAFEKKDYKSVRKIFNELIKKIKNKKIIFHLYYVLSKTYKEEKKWDKERNTIMKMIEIYPESISYFSHRYISQKDYKNFMKLTALIKKHRDFAIDNVKYNYFRSLGDVSYAMKDYNNSDKYYERTIFLSNSLYEKQYLVLRRTVIAAMQNNNKRLNELFIQFSKFLTDNANNYFQAGNVFAGQKLTEKAIELYEKGLKYRQKSVDADNARNFIREHTKQKYPDHVKWQFTKDSFIVTYYTNVKTTTLKKTKKILLHYGVNGWGNVKDLPLKKINKSTYKLSIKLEDNVKSIQFVFTDGNGNWDNNNGMNWELKR